MTPTQRYSAMNISMPWRGLNAVPTGTVDGQERAAVMFLYAFTGAAPPVGGSRETFPFMHNIGRMMGR